MKYFFATICFFCNTFFVKAQVNIADSLKESLSHQQTDSSRTLLLLQICDQYIYSKPDSALIFAQQGLTLAQGSGFQLGEARSLTRIGNILKSAGNFPKALETHLDALKISEKINDLIGIAASYNNMAEVFKEQRDYKQALYYSLKTKSLFETIVKNAESKMNENSLQNKNKLRKYKGYLATSLLNIGDAYDRLNQLDSALIFQNQAYEIANMINNKDIIGAILSNLGSIEYKRGNFDLSLSFYKTGVPKLLEINDQQFLSNTYLGIAEVYEKKQNPDSAIYYGKLALSAGQNGFFQKEILNAAKLLSNFYEAERKFDTALYFSNLEKDINDTILNEEKIRQVQNLNVMEQLRQQEIAVTKEKEKKERKDNLQMFGIGIFIVTFFIVLMLISQKKTRPRAMHYAGLIGLLLLFEFITVFLHPYISNLTHHTPVYVLLISVGVAAILTPMHHRLTDWIKHRLAKKKRGRPSKKNPHAGRQTPVVKKTDD